MSSGTGEYGSFWSFRQKEVLLYLSTRLQSFFAYVLSKESGTNWLSYLLDPNSAKVTEKYLEDERGMYSTAGFLHAAGKTISLDGQVVSIAEAGGNSLYEFVPIEVRCSDDGITEWHRVSKAMRYIFRIRDKERYRDAMVAALKSLLTRLP
jgi:hypothetical protein